MRALRLRPERRQPARELQSATGIAEGSWFVNAESGRALPKVDVLIVGRGGGSVESLWSLNEEEARHGAGGLWHRRVEEKVLRGGRFVA